MTPARLTLAALIAFVAIIAAVIAIRLHQPAKPSADGVAVVAGATRAADPWPVTQNARAPEPALAPTIQAMIEEAPPVLKSLHAGVEAERDGRSPVEERRVAALFAGNAALSGTPVTVRCTRRRCEVHGTANTDEDVTRLAIRDGDFLDRIAATGYSAGTDMVSGRDGGSEFIVYLETGR